MAQKRMFDRNIVTDDDFLELSVQAQCLYFHIGLVADDDGLTKNYKSYMKLIGATDDDVNSLIEKGFIYQFESGVIVVRHWMIHNTIRRDRYRETIFQKEFKQLSIAENNEYILLNNDGIPDGNQMETENSIVKYSIGDDSSAQVTSVQVNQEKINQENNSKGEVREMSFSIMNEDDIFVKDVMDYLNKKLNTSYNWENNETKKLIINLKNKGFKKLDFQIVIDKKYDEWHNNKMVSQLRPLTLFGDKFEMYLNQPVKEKTLADLTMDELNQLMESEESNISEDENDTFTIC